MAGDPDHAMDNADKLHAVVLAGAGNGFTLAADRRCQHGEHVHAISPSPT